MSQRKLLELDTRFFSGKRITVDFSQRNYQGSSTSDYAVLKCPSSTVNQPTTIDLREKDQSIIAGTDSSDYVVIGSEMFLNPCNIDGQETTMILNNIKGQDDTFLIWVSSTAEDTKFTYEGRRIILKGIDKIINEHGDVILDLTTISARFYDIYHEHASKTTDSVARIMGLSHTEEVKNNILTCIQGTGDISEEEREELCEGNSNE